MPRLRAKGGRFSRTSATAYRDYPNPKAGLTAPKPRSPHFRLCNEQLGQARADAALQQVARLLHNHVPCEPGLLARFAGGEFVVALINTPLQRAVGTAERVRKAVEALRVPMGREPHAKLTISLGVSSMRPSSPHASLPQLIAVAEEALAMATQRGCNRVVAFGTHD